MARSLDEPGDVRDDELAVGETRDAEVGHERGERIVRDLRARARQRREERRFSGVRHARETDICEELQLEIDLAPLALAAVLGDARRAARARREARVALSADATARDDELLAGSHEVGDRRIRRAVDHDRSRWQEKDPVRTGSPGALPPRAGLAGLGPGLVRETEISEGAELWVHAEHDVATLSAVAAIGSASRDVGLAAERDHATSAVAALDHEPRAIEEHLDPRERSHERSHAEVRRVACDPLEEPLHAERRLG